MKSKRIVTLLLTLFLLTGCTTVETNTPNTSSDPISLGDKVNIAGNDGTLPADFCKTNNLTNKFVMIESKYCGHCQVDLPVFKEITKELNIEPIILDLSEESDRKMLEEFNLNVKYTPTYVFDCKYHVGSKTKAEFSEILN